MSGVSTVRYERKLTDLVEETAEAALALWNCAVIVGFERETKFVFYRPDEGAMLDELTKLTDAGGKPVGLMGFESEPGKEPGTSILEVKTRPFKEYSGEAWVADYLRRLVETFRLLATSEDTPC